ncbi:MAG: hypothetical protein ACYDIC_00745 [Desulfobaccales bacterium]
MKKTMLIFLVTCLVGAVGCGGGSARTETATEKPISPEVATAEKSVQPEATDEGKPLPIEGTRAAQYRRLAFVCAPGPGADPKYVPMILKEIETTVPKYLAGQNLQKVNIIPDASIDFSTVPPTVRFKTINDYDAVAVITYTYSPMVLMDINLLDAKTGQKVWFLQIHAKPDNIELRLNKLAHIVPHRINKYFYRKG